MLAINWSDLFLYIGIGIDIHINKRIIKRKLTGGRMKKVNMTQLARQTKDVVAMSFEGAVLVSTPSKIDDVVMIPESKHSSNLKLIDQLVWMAAKYESGVSYKDALNQWMDAIKSGKTAQEMRAELNKGVGY